MDGEIVDGFMGRLVVAGFEGGGGEHGEDCACVGRCETFSLVSRRG